MYAFWTLQRHSLVPPTQVSWRLFASLVPPPNLLNMISSIYHSSSNQYRDFQYPLRRGIKEGCPLSPSLFILVYEAFHATLTREFPTARFFVYVDDIAVVTPDKATLRRVLHRTNELSMSLGFRINHSKTEIYRWAPRHKCASITWEGNGIKILAPVFKYLGHHLAHPNFLGRAQTELMSQKVHCVRHGCDTERTSSLWHAAGLIAHVKPWEPVHCGCMQSLEVAITRQIPIFFQNI